jgi:lipoyl synthase
VTADSGGSTLRVRWLGRLPYTEGWDLQRAIHEGKVVGRTSDDYLLLLEHPPVFTVGRNGDGSNLLVDRAGLGAEVHDVDRGGDITFHGPGQLVGYPILTLEDPKQIVPYVRSLEQTLIGTLADFGVEAWAEPGYTGVWTARGKVAAIGVRVARQVTMHGFALNLHPDLAYFGMMNPCGITDRPVTTLSELLGRKVTLEEATEVLIPRFEQVFGYHVSETQLGAFARGQARRSEFEVDRLVEAGTFSQESRSAEPILINGRLPGEPPRPDWMKVTARLDGDYLELKKMMRKLQLNTVCEEANCPNIYECWGMGTATLMILGDKCTRACSFCNVTTGKPTEFDVLEPFRAAEAIHQMNLKHAVITSVNRDDLADGGAGIFAHTIRESRRLSPGTEIEVLIPDFKGDREALQTVMDAVPEVLNHNTETVLRLQRDIRTAANYGRSLAMLWRAKQMNPDGLTKSGLIVGMGETRAEVLGALADMRAVGIDIITIGQYLRPTPRHRPIHRYVHPDEFAEYKAFGEGLGIPHIESGPLVRSSYHAKESREAVGI